MFAGMSSLPTTATLRDVGLRDGIQSLGAFISTEHKIELLEALGETGLSRLEATSFVSPRHVPQMADADEVMRRVRRTPGVRYEALVPNVRGAERALAVGVDALVFVTAASDAFNLKNVQMTVDASLGVAEQVAERARQAGVPILAGIATSFGCPYSGDVPLSRLLSVVERLAHLGFSEIGLADTTGMANPLQVERFFEDLGLGVELTAHFHNTRGQGLANAVSALRAGVRSFESSFGELGGCPVPKGATGNIATEDLVSMLHEMGVETGIDLDRLLEAAREAQRVLGRPLGSHTIVAGPVDWHR
jgi:hydroxymethylglutaryl-CoA lyase